MSDVICTKHETVLHVRTANSTHIEFSRDQDEPGDIPDKLLLTRANWVDMGKPTTVTVTVRPGDHLNVPEVRQGREYDARGIATEYPLGSIERPFA